MLSSTITTMFVSFVMFVTGVIAIVEAVNKLFMVENKRAKLIISWSISIGMAIIGLIFQIGFFESCGPINEWQSWVKTIFIGFGSALAANKIYDREEIWDILEFIFSFFKKDGKEIRSRLNDKLKSR